ncbi:hypothetical protein AM1_0597 [Acaryochloris marina MBIC11017]|uniref:Methyltransferase domain-containing protein n=2 Tax=Acaryochloris marina TaxID=155978 RepID=B0CD56_ACAM1|nr:hypothetical protein AM1_0597 [Acaryochloris marina MBIC11017]
MPIVDKIRMTLNNTDSEFNHPRSKLKDHKALEQSDIVANITMNRNRALMGDNSYGKEFDLNPATVLENRLKEKGEAAWLDLCCGRGRALIDAAIAFGTNDLTLHGVDLVDHFDPRSTQYPAITLTVSSLHTWTTTQRYDLVTCIYGLHYIGDKLGLITKAVSWLNSNGIFLANLDLNHVLNQDGTAFTKKLTNWFQTSGFEFDRQSGVLQKAGSAMLSSPFEYLGADDRAGPNATGQPGVASYYRV